MSEVTGAAHDAAEATRSPAYFPAIDGLRCFATVMVVLHHTANNSGGFKNPTLGGWYARTETAVPIFLLISGFVMFRPFVAGYLSGAPMTNVKRFFRRRALRVYPAYLFALFFVVIVFGDFKMRGLGDWAWYGSFAYLYDFSHYRLTPIQPAWTVSAEITYYLLLPAFVHVLRRGGTTPAQRVRRVYVGLAAWVAGSFAWKLLVYSRLLVEADDRVEWLVRWLPGWTDMLAAGMLMATLSAAASQGVLRLPAFLESRRLPAVSWGLALGVYALLSAGLGLPTSRFDYSGAQYFLVHYLDLVFASLLMLPAAFGDQSEGLVRRFLTWKPVAFAGTVSYGIYLWHIALIARFYKMFDVRPFTGALPQLFLFTLAGSIAAATVSYYLVERPAQRLGRPRVRARSGAARGST